jgi:predicted signal transduction protein with EAL and GGDEF domain
MPPRVAQKILDTVAEPFTIDPHELSVSASLGVALYPDDGHDLEALVRCADSAMYRAKQNGRNGYSFFTSDLEAEAVRRLQIVSALRHALELHQLSLRYQPQFDARNGALVGAEVLLRWQHRDWVRCRRPNSFLPPRKAARCSPSANGCCARRCGRCAAGSTKAWRRS